MNRKRKYKKYKLPPINVEYKKDYLENKLKRKIDEKKFQEQQKAYNINENDDSQCTSQMYYQTVKSQTPTKW